VAGLAVVATVGATTPVSAKNEGFSVARYVPTAAGEWTFMVDHPWYSSTRYFAAGITLDYAHAPLVLGRLVGSDFVDAKEVISHQLIGHVDIAGSFLDRFLLSASLPVRLLDSGQVVSSVGPAGAGLGDPNLGIMARLVGQPNSSPFSLNLGLRFWIPTGGNGSTAGDTGLRAMPKVVVAGLERHIQWSLSVGLMYRNTATLPGVPAGSPGATVGPELNIGAAVAWADLDRRFSVGPEASLSTVITDGYAFQKSFTSLEMLLGGYYNIAKQVNVGAAVGVGMLREPGTPDARALLRVAYAPMSGPAPKDTDGDGIPDATDACVTVKGVVTNDPKTNGCPPDGDADGIPDAEDACPTVKGVASSDPAKHGCPPDSDGDGVPDSEDLCPAEPTGATPDPAKRGCPIKDADGDGVLDQDDLCPTVPVGPKADPKRAGCPFVDGDGDGVADSEDLCPNKAAGPRPDPTRPGCPAPDEDDDSVPDAVDACPHEVGAPNPDPKKNGCPGLVQVKKGNIVILDQVYFATNKAVILPKSTPVLTAVADTLKMQPEIRLLSVDGHTDDRGKADKNKALSDARAKAVREWLIQHGIDGSRLESHGYGQEKPIDTNKTDAGRAKNRRVEFKILTLEGAAK
jgi:outer membrane protein OmpA-like peptidoglycan-associated protein